WYLGKNLNIALIVSTLISACCVAYSSVAKGETSIVMRSRVAVTGNKRPEKSNMDKSVVVIYNAGEDLRDLSIISSRSNYGPVEERHEPRLAMSIVRYENREIHSAVDASSDDKTVIFQFLFILSLKSTNYRLCFKCSGKYALSHDKTDNLKISFLELQTKRNLCVEFRLLTERSKPLTQAEHKSQVAQSQPALARATSGCVSARRGARDLRSRIDPGLEIEDINQRSAAALVHVGGRY
ncbi:hypothetical protein ALC62_12246, partial [Cyphomyrmex costatus]